MTIKRRLFWSNILMLVLPVVLSAAISYLILFVFTRDSRDPMEKAFPKAFEIIWQFQTGDDEASLLEKVEAFNSDFRDSAVSMVVLRGEALLYPRDIDEIPDSRGRLLTAILREGISGNVTVNDTRYLIENHGEYRIVLVDRQSRFFQRATSGRPIVLHAGTLFLIMIAMILLTNRMLTRMITRRITASLNTLVHGVHEIGDGNLDYRIEYSRRDEFAPICDDFNVMAEHIQRLIQRQQKDEESRKELLAGISHDLRTPLTSIKAYVEGLLDGVAEDYPAQLRYLSIIRQKAVDIDEIVDKLFLFSKLEIGEFPFYHERMDIGDELAAMADSINEESAQSGMTMVLAEQPRDLYVYADPVQLQGALTNILDNSRKYKQKERGTITVDVRDDGDTVTIRLTDDGPGVPEESLERLFDVFYRSDPSRQNPSKGSGLGLAITAKIMNRMGGSIRAENAPEGGLCILLTLPKYMGEEPAQ